MPFGRNDISEHRRQRRTELLKSIEGVWLDTPQASR
jgi:hypothetical protein